CSLSFSSDPYIPVRICLPYNFPLSVIFSHISISDPRENTSFFLSVNMISYLLYQIALRIRDSPASLPSSGKKQERNRYKRKSMEYTFTELFWLLLVYSFIGWVIEAMVGSIKNKRFTNRGFST